MKGSLLVAGTGSDAGKSVIVAGICRMLVRRGIRVAPFKAQNMSLNSAVTPDGAEIGRAQFSQAQAAGAVPEAAMNPVLLKPTSDRSSQIVVMGRPRADADAVSYQELRRELGPVALEALASLRSRFEVVICEGAGSLAEINLREHDFVNMGLARESRMPVVLVADIDRGGSFASLFGSLAVLDPHDQKLVAGFVLNKFRGDPTILTPALNELSARTGRRFLGVIPWTAGLWMDEEDSVALERARWTPIPPLGRDSIHVAVVALPRMSNFTDVDALAAEPGVVVRFTDAAGDILDSDLVILPGTKTTLADLAWFRSSGLDRALAERAVGGRPILGICGGYQMLGRRIVDEVESRAGTADGLGLLPVETIFHTEKVLGTPYGVAPPWGNVDVAGYEIHHGRTTRSGGEPAFSGSEGEEGCRLGAVVGTAWHGVLEGDGFRRALLGWVADESGLRWVPGSRPFREVREAKLDLLGDLIERHIDVEILLRLIESGAPSGLPVLATELVVPAAPSPGPEKRQRLVERIPNDQEVAMSTQDRAANALNVPLLTFVGAKPLDEHELSKGLQLKWSPDVLNAVGGIHAGALATTLEVAAYLALLPQLAESEEAVTHDFSASYVAAVSPGAVLRFTGSVLRRGRNVAFVSVEARVEGELVAIAHVTKSIRQEGKTPPSTGRSVSRA